MPARRFTRALISVSDKSGIVELAGDLHRQGIDIVASDGTAATLRGAGISARVVSEIEAQRLDDLRRDPPRTDLVARELRAIEQEILQGIEELVGMLR